MHSPVCFQQTLQIGWAIYCEVQALSSLFSQKEQAVLLEIGSAGCDTRRSGLQFVCCQPCGEKRTCTPASLSLVIFSLWILGTVFLAVLEFPPHSFPTCTYFSHVPVVIFSVKDPLAFPFKHPLPSRGLIAEFAYFFIWLTELRVGVLPVFSGVRMVVTVGKQEWERSRMSFPHVSSVLRHLASQGRWPSLVFKIDSSHPSIPCFVMTFELYTNSVIRTIRDPHHFNGVWMLNWLESFLIIGIQCRLQGELFKEHFQNKLWWWECDASVRPWLTFSTSA